MEREHSDSGIETPSGSLERTMKEFLNLYNDQEIKISKSSVKILNLFNHHKSQCIEKIPGCGFAVTNPGDTKPIIFHGLHRRLKETIFYMSTEEDEKKREKSEYASIERSCPTYGRNHGSLVHDQIDACVKTLSRKATKDLTLPHNPDMCTINILSSMLEEGWFPVLSEFPIWSQNKCMATACDVIAIDLFNDKFVLLEIKTEYENTEYESTEKDMYLPFPFDYIKDCPDTRHQFQLATMVLMLSREYNIDVDEARVIVGRSKRKGVDIYKLPAWMLSQFFSDLWSAIGV